MQAIELSPQQLNDSAAMVAQRLKANDGPAPTLLNTPQLARELNISESSVARLAKAGKIPSIKAGGTLGLTCPR